MSLNVLEVESHFAVFTVERPGFTFPLTVSVLLRKEDCRIAGLAHNSLKLTATFMLSLILFNGSCPTAALIQAPCWQTCYFSPCGIVWKHLTAV